MLRAGGQIEGNICLFVQVPPALAVGEFILGVETMLFYPDGA